MTEPSPFYFNGERLSDWAGCWSLVGFDAAMGRRDGDWVGAIGHSQLIALSRRLMTEGELDSEYPELMRLACLEFSVFALEERGAAVDALVERLDPDDPVGLLGEIVSGTRFMLELTRRDKAAFWSRGDMADVDAMKETMRRCRLPKDDPDFQLPRHITDWKREIESKETGLQSRL